MRGVSRALGIEVRHDHSPMGACFSALDPTLDRAWPESGLESVRKFEAHYRTGVESALKALHEMVYHARGEEVYRRQEGKCAMCGRKMPANAYEIDHKIPRSRGRDDRIENLRAVCTGLNGCDLHRRKHGG